MYICMMCVPVSVCICSEYAICDLTHYITAACFKRADLLYNQLTGFATKNLELTSFAAVNNQQLTVHH